MITIILLFTSLLMQTHGIPLNEDEDASVTPKGRYHFNHPPTIEEYNPILESIKYNEDSVYKPRVYKDVSDVGDELISSDNTSAEIVLNKSNISDVQVVKKEPKPKGPIAENEATAPAVTQTDSTKLNNENEFTSEKKNNVRKTKVLKRIMQESVKNETSFTKNNNVSKLRKLQTTTLKPTVTTLKVISSPKASTEIYSANQKQPRQRDPVVPILESENYVFAHNGDFHYSYEGGDGTKASEQGKLKVFDDKTAGEAVVGSFSYTDKDGNDFSLSYTADEKGYRPVGDHLPTPPPIPPAIARALQYLSTKTPTESSTEI